MIYQQISNHQIQKMHDQLMLFESCSNAGKQVQPAVEQKKVALEESPKPSRTGRTSAAWGWATGWLCALITHDIALAVHSPPYLMIFDSIRTSCLSGTTGAGLYGSALSRLLRIFWMDEQRSPTKSLPSPVAMCSHDGKHHGCRVAVMYSMNSGPRSAGGICN